MKSKREEIILTEHKKYQHFLSGQLIIDLDKGDTVKILINDKEEFSISALYENSHINLKYQFKEKQCGKKENE